MASFIHLADQKNEKSIFKNGIKVSRRGIRGVYAFPVVRDYATTHQWSRELKKTGVKTLICVQFRVPDDDMVLIGRYNDEKAKMTAAEALSAVIKHVDPKGLEIIVPRKILAQEITRIYLAPRITGWRYYPEAKGKKPFCPCKYCNRGEIKAQRLIQKDA
jgi:hypothetical protein